MSLQLYQVDYKSYLLDFKSLVEEEGQGVEVTSTMEKPDIVEMRESAITGHHRPSRAITGRRAIVKTHEILLWSDGP